MSKIKSEQDPLVYAFVILIGVIWVFTNWIVATIAAVLILGITIFFKLYYNPSMGVDESSIYQWPSEGNFEVEVVGESNYQDAIQGISKLGKQHTALLYLDDSNSHDSKAVAIYINKLLVGYLSRDDARAFRRRLKRNKLSDQNTKCTAEITGGYVMKDGKTASLGISLDIEPLD